MKLQNLSLRKGLGQRQFHATRVYLPVSAAVNLGLNALALFIGTIAMASPALNWTTENNLGFAPNSSVLDQGGAQIAFKFVSIADATDPQAVASKNPQLILDHSNQLSAAFAAKNATDDSRIGKLFLVKSIFKIKRPLKDIYDQFTTQNNMALLQKAFGYSYDPSCKIPCEINQKIKYGIKQFNMTLDLSPYFLGLDPKISKADYQSLGLDKALYEFRISAANWSQIFTVSQTSSFAIPQGLETLIVNYQFFSVRESAYSDYPFFLELATKSIITDQAASLINFLRTTSADQKVSFEYNKEPLAEPWFNDVIGSGISL